MPRQVIYVDFSADNSVRMTLAAAGERPPAPVIRHCHSLDDLGRELSAFLATQGQPPLLGAALSVCGWERDGIFEMPDASYSIEREWIRQRLGVNRVHLVNDIVAAALAVDRLDATELSVVCKAPVDPDRPKAMVALGRSLGTTTLTTDEFGAAVAIPCLGGHCDLAAITQREFDVVSCLTRRYGHVPRVRALSTQGLVAVYHALQELDTATVTPIEPQALVALARQGDAHACEAVGLVLGWLAAVAADTVLATGARGGLYLAGSFFDLMGDRFDREAFAARFTAKGRVGGILAAVPVFIVTASEPEMIGLTTLFD